ncbi:MAG: nuclease [Chloroflexi bacterium]|nr:nuclease [Chloroflexota bacterium]
MPGTRVDATVVRVVDGDTLRVAAGEREESLRILALDTEESNAGSSKPVTPWGHEAKKEAQKLFQPGDAVSLEFPGHESAETCWERYRGNYGRPLVFVYLRDGRDFQEHMIREGFSPYFVKYGYAQFPENHYRYTQAEREAQVGFRGVWDQIKVNGSEMRNYAGLGVWWHLRAHIIEGYRYFKSANPGARLYNTRLDYDELYKMSKTEDEVTIFTEVRNFKRVGGIHAIIGIGSIHQPFQVFIPRMDDEPGQRIISLLTNRYIPGGSGEPRRSYVYITGPLKLYNDRPEIVLTDVAQLSDWPMV